MTNQLTLSAPGSGGGVGPGSVIGCFEGGTPSFGFQVTFCVSRGQVCLLPESRRNVKYINTTFVFFPDAQKMKSTHCGKKFP